MYCAPKKLTLIEVTTPIVIWKCDSPVNKPVAWVEEQDMITIHNWFSASVSRHVHLHLHDVFLTVIIILHVISFLKIRCYQGNSTSGPLVHEVERPRYNLIGGRDVIWGDLLFFPLVLVYDQFCWIFHYCKFMT